MNPEYLVLGGGLWKMLRKPTTLWYIHPKSSWRLWIARVFATHIVSATEKSFPLRSKRLIPIGLGVDTDFFSPGVTASGNDFKVMLAARIAPVKRIECVIGAISELMRRNVPVVFDYYGGALPRDREYAEALYKLVPAATPPDMWRWHGDSMQTQVRDAYRTHDVHVNATESGSFDKAVFESMACGCITVVSNRALRGIVPNELIFEEGDSASLADALERIYRLVPAERTELKKKMRAIAEEKYSLSALIERVVKVLGV
jgi:glycosyltransferase involved in cell wall biosynthesis